MNFHLPHAINSQRGYLHASVLFISLFLPFKNTGRSINDVILACLTKNFKKKKKKKKQGRGSTSYLFLF
jgi:hypothetical protein